MCSRPTRTIRRLHFATAASPRLYARHLTTAACRARTRAVADGARVAAAFCIRDVTVASLRARRRSDLGSAGLDLHGFRRVRAAGWTAHALVALHCGGDAAPICIAAHQRRRKSPALHPRPSPPASPRSTRQRARSIPHGRSRMRAWLAEEISLVAVGGVVGRHSLAVVLFFVLGPVAGLVRLWRSSAAGIYFFRLLRQWATDEQAAQALSQAGQTAASVASLSDQQQLRAQHSGITFVPTLGGARQSRPRSASTRRSRSRFS